MLLHEFSVIPSYGRSIWQNTEYVCENNEKIFRFILFHFQKMQVHRIRKRLKLQQFIYFILKIPDTYFYACHGLLFRFSLREKSIV